jgi:hypothetical protein
MCMVYVCVVCVYVCVCVTVCVRAENSYIAGRQVAGCGLRVAGRGSRVAGCGSRITICILFVYFANYFQQCTGMLAIDITIIATNK